MDFGAARGETWQVRKAVCISPGGMVASQHHLASKAGADILAAGGNAIDAAVATAFAVGVVEPWMSGIGGGGCLIYAPVGQPPRMLDFTMASPRGLDPARYKIVPGKGGDLFDWPKVEADRNLRGYESICVPSALEGLGAALELFGSFSLAEVLAPAIALARAGVEVEWLTTLMIASEALSLAQDKAACELYLPSGQPPVVPLGGPAPRLDFSRLADTMERIAKGGRRVFYEGDLARELVSELNAGGNRIALDDLARCRAQLLEPEIVSYRGTEIAAAAGLTAGPSMKVALEDMSANFAASGPRPAADSYLAYAGALQRAFKLRLAEYGHDGMRFGAEPGNTTNLCVVDAKGNMVALTNTLLSLFGSKVVLPGLGLPMNNGMVSFNPQSGHPNALAAGRKPLSNMCPMVAYRDGRPWVAIGGCGGRKIMPAVFQLACFLIDYGMSLEEAFHQPRIDASSGPVLCDRRMDPAWIERLARDYPVSVVEDGVYPNHFATPSAVMREAPGRFSGMTRVSLPSAAAIGPG